MLNPINGQLLTVGDTVVAQLQGDPQIILSLAGNFTGATVIIEATPLGQAAGTWLPYAEVRVDTGYVMTSGQIGPISNPGLGSGLTLRADGGAIAAIRIRLLAIGAGAVTGGIAGVPFPYSSSVQIVTGTVAVSGDFMKNLLDTLLRLREPSLGMSLEPLTLDLANRPSPLDLVVH